MEIINHDDLNNKIESLKRLYIAIEDVRKSGFSIDEKTIYNSISLNASGFFNNCTIIDFIDTDFKNKMEEISNGMEDFYKLFQRK